METCKGCKHYKKDERTRLIVCEFGLHESYCEKDKEDFAIAELEKIREEIENDQEQMANEKDWGRYYGMGWSIRIIDKHISELKGEQE